MPIRQMIDNQTVERYCPYGLQDTHYVVVSQLTADSHDFYSQRSWLWMSIYWRIHSILSKVKVTTQYCKSNKLKEIKWRPENPLVGYKDNFIYWLNQSVALSEQQNPEIVGQLSPSIVHKMLKLWLWTELNKGKKQHFSDMPHIVAFPRWLPLTLRGRHGSKIETCSDFS